jgi:hypothetical protein
MKLHRQKLLPLRIKKNIIVLHCGDTSYHLHEFRATILKRGLLLQYNIMMIICLQFITKSSKTHSKLKKRILESLFQSEVLFLKKEKRCICFGIRFGIDYAVKLSEYQKILRIA